MANKYNIQQIIDNGTYVKRPWVDSTGVSATFSGITSNTPINADGSLLTNLESNIGLTGNFVGFAPYQSHTGDTSIHFTKASLNSSFVNKSGDTIDGNLDVNGILSATTISATTFYGDDSNLTGIESGSGTGLTATITVGENVISGDLLYLNTDGKYWKADNGNELSASTELRLANATILADAVGASIIQDQYITTGLTSGSNYWVGTAGTFTDTQPTADGSIVRYVGTAIGTTILDFNPDGLYVEISSNPSTVQSVALRSFTGNTTLLSTDYTANVLSAATITLPTAVGIAGRIYNIKNSSTGTVTVATFGGQTIDGGTLTLTTQYQSVTVQSDGTNWIII